MPGNQTTKRLFSRRTRITLLLIGIALGLVEIQTRFVGKALDVWTQKRITSIAHYRTSEFVNHWFGTPLSQFPGDLLTYQDLIWEIKPDYIIEAGTSYGGLTLYLAMVLEHVNPEGKVITLDITDELWNETVALGKVSEKLAARIHFIKGDDVSQEVLKQVREIVQGSTTLIILDTLHSKEHVLKELEAYQEFVSPDSYLIVNDTHHDDMYRNPGPRAAVDEFLRTTTRFTLRKDLPRFTISSIKSGVLQRTQ